MENFEHEDYGRIWRDPAEESTDIYPGLVVLDDRVGGSITVRKSRLPLWTLIGTAIEQNWQDVEDSWNVTDYDYTAKELSDFVYNLLDCRGEFARLLLEIANANKEHLHWWTDETLKEKVRDQLTLCVASLTRDERPIQPTDTI